MREHENGVHRLVRVAHSAGNVEEPLLLLLLLDVTTMFSCSPQPESEINKTANRNGDAADREAKTYDGCIHLLTRSHK